MKRSKSKLLQTHVIKDTKLTTEYFKVEFPKRGRLSCHGNAFVFTQTKHNLESTEYKTHEGNISFRSY